MGKGQRVKEPLHGIRDFDMTGGEWLDMGVKFNKTTLDGHANMNKHHIIGITDLEWHVEWY